MQIGTAIDDNFVLPFLVWLMSLASSNIQEVSLGYITNSLSDTSLTLIKAVSEKLSIGINLIALEPQLFPPGARHISSTGLARLEMAKLQALIPFIWLDADGILRKPPQSGCESPYIEQIQAAIAVCDSGLIVAEREQGRRDYFNSGFLVFTQPIRKFDFESSNLADLDQSLLNQLYPDNHKISSSFNVLSNTRELIHETDLFLHFAGNFKPWHLPRKDWARCASAQCPWSEWFEIYNELLDASGSLAKSIETLRLGMLKTGPTGIGYSLNRLYRVLGRPRSHRLTPSFVQRKLIHPNHAANA